MFQGNVTVPGAAHTMIMMPTRMFMTPTFAGAGPGGPRRATTGILRVAGTVTGSSQAHWQPPPPLGGLPAAAGPGGVEGARPGLA